MPQQDASRSFTPADYRHRQHDLSFNRAARAGGAGWERRRSADPMADFTYLLMQWTMPGLAHADLAA